MVVVRIDDSLIKKFEKKFKPKELKEIKKLFFSLQENPFQGDLLYTFGAFVLKEKKYKTFRFYFIHSRTTLIIKDIEELKDELVRFIETGKKNNQQKVFDKLKDMLKKLWYL